MKDNLIRTGIGIDLHSFEECSAIDTKLSRNTEKNNVVIFGGIAIQCRYAIRAHSDGDALLHAISDAIYGAIGCGNIGVHFPANDPRWNNCSSEIFVRHAQKKALELGWIISYIDSSLICEEPKIMPYSAIISSNIARILGLDSRLVSTKATTPEGLPFMGVKHGVVAFAICTLKHIYHDE